LAKSFLDPSAEACLDAFSSGLDVIRSNAPRGTNSAEVNRKHPWSIPDYQPLRTKRSRRYEKGKREGGLEIYGQLTAVWEIVPDAKKTRCDRPKQFRVVGKASVLVKLVDSTSDRAVSEWHMDVADPASPGCMFHSQFPSAVPIPRLPCIAFTPLTVAEFVLGELFQGDWEALGCGAACENWSAIQKKRLSRLLGWQQQIVDGCVGPPWTALKRERLPFDRFVAAT
jgi:hypothetical protein